MSVIRLLLREIQHRKLNFIAALVAVIAAVTLPVALVTMTNASQRETVRLMRNLGLNLLIVPQDTDMADFWSDDFAKEEMPEEYVHRLANSRLVTVRHLVARLQKRTTWRDRTILLTGILPEVPMAHRKLKSPMGLTVPRGTAFVGFELARSMDISVGDTLQFDETRLQVTRCLDEKGSKDDIRVYGHLHDVQQILGSPGRINEIEALGCLCNGVRSITRVRSDVASVLPGTQVTELASIAIARAETRRMVEKQAAFVIPIVVLACAVWIGLLALSNVRERRAEIGILRAMGVGTPTIAAAFIGKAVLLGLLGAGVGFAIGTALALHFGPQIFPLTAKKVAAEFGLLGWSLLLAPLLCIAASYLPTVIAITQDPAEVLREE